MFHRVFPSINSNTFLFAILFGIAGVLFPVYGQAQTDSTCHHMTISDRDTNLELVDKDFVLTENPGGVNLVIQNNKILPTIKKLNQPAVRFCYHGHIITAYGNPILSSSIPKGSSAFYPLDSNNKIHFFANRISILIVDKVVRKK